MRNKEQITTIMKGGCSKSGTWKYFDQHLVNGVKYGCCKDETCPGKSQKNRRKTECDVGGEILIRCTGSNTASLWYHLQVYHPETYKAAYELKEKNKKEKEEEEMAAFHFSQGKKNKVHSRCLLESLLDQSTRKVILLKKLSIRISRI